MRRVRALLALTLLMTAVAAAPPRAQTPAATPQELFKDDVHAQAGLTCASCHTLGRGAHTGRSSGRRSRRCARRATPTRST